VSEREDGPLLDMIGIPLSIRRSGPPTYHTTGLSDDEIVQLSVLVWQESAGQPGSVWPPILGLYNSIRVA